jgi:hypothetical protein
MRAAAVEAVVAAAQQMQKQVTAGHHSWATTNTLLSCRVESRYHSSVTGATLKRLVVVLSALTVLALSVRANSQVSTGKIWSLEVTEVTSPAASNSAQPQLSSQGDRVVLSWIERSGDLATLRFAERTDSGWSEGRTVASGSNWFVNWADVPSVIGLQNGNLAAHWLQKSAASTYAYDVRLSFSKDHGRTWSASGSPHRDGTRTEHGFASLFQTPGAGLGLVWLDGRQMKEGAHEGMDAGDMSLRSAIYKTDGTQATEMLVDNRVCECCPSAAAVTADGPIVAYRNRTADEIRDIYISRFVGGTWTEPRAVHSDNWRIAACPVNGPALSASGRNVAIAWFTAVGDEGHVYVAFSSNAGETFGSPIRIDDVGSVGRVDVELLPDGSAAVTWIEFANQRSEFRIRRVGRDGSRTASLAVSGIASGRSSGYPRLARRGNELIFAWTEPGESSRIRTAVARLAST